MLDMGFWPDVRRILKLAAARSARTCSSARRWLHEVIKVVDSVLTDPVRVEVIAAGHAGRARSSRRSTPCATRRRPICSWSCSSATTTVRTLVFTRTKHRADRVSRQLSKRGVRSEAIHGNRSQNQRERALEAFRSGRSRVLVATDVMARGIDVDKIGTVVNYDMPNSTEDYVHRIGRTARAGCRGQRRQLSLRRGARHSSGTSSGTSIPCSHARTSRASATRSVSFRMPRGPRVRTSPRVVRARAAGVAAAETGIGAAPTTGAATVRVAKASAPASETARLANRIRPAPGEPAE